MQQIRSGAGEKLKADYKSLKTLTGLTLDEALKALQRQLEPAAYKNVTTGGREFTDIKPAWLTEVLTSVFGIAGIGWHYGYDEPVITSSAEKSRSGREYILWQADIMHGWFTYRVVDAEGNWYDSEMIWATGGSDNEVKEYAVRGALTNMLGAAASKLTWQLFVYKGEKEAPNDEPEKVEDTRPWYIRALEYAAGHKEVSAVTLGNSEAGKKVITQLKTLVGAEGWWDKSETMLKAIKAYTGYKVPEEMMWKDFNRLVRIYAGPFAIATETIKDVAFNHFLKPSEWQSLLAAVPLPEDMVLTPVLADALNTLIPSVMTFRKDGKTDIEAMASNLRQHLINTAEDHTTPTSEVTA